MHTKLNVKSLFAGKLGIVLGLIILVIVYTLLSPVFFTMGNFSNIMVQSATNAIVALGMTFVIICGQIDLSVGSTLALSIVIGAKVMVATENVLLGCLVTLVCAVALGAVNGVLIACLKFQPFIVTLSTMWLFRGFGYVVTDGVAVSPLPDGMMSLALGSFIGIPYIVWIIIIAYVLSFILLSRLTLGRRIFAVGDNEESARLSGIRIIPTKMFVYMFSGFMAGLAGLIVLSRMNSGQPIAGESYEMYAIAAAVIGGASLTKGGIGSVVGTLIGAIFIATLQNGLTILNVSSFWQQVFMGLVTLLAVALDAARKKISQQ